MLAVTGTGREETHEMGNIIEGGYGSPEFLYFYRRKLSPAFKRLRKLGILAETCPNTVIRKPEEARALCEAQTDTSSYVFYTRQDVDAFNAKKAIYLHVHAEDQLKEDMIFAALRWFIPRVEFTCKDPACVLVGW